MLDPETGEVMREDVFRTVQKDIKYSGENLEAFRLDAERAGAPSIGFPLEQDSLLYPTSKDYKAITSALDPQMANSYSFSGIQNVSVSGVSVAIIYGKLYCILVSFFKQASI